MNNEVFKVKLLLKAYSEKDIIFSTHAEIRCIQRNISKEEVIANILNPKRLTYAIESNINKFDCYFLYSNTQCHRYILSLQKKAIIVTVVKINRRWQRIIEKRLRK
jgi:hypothetical protein